MMTKRFALSAVLAVREQREKAEERALAQINAQCNELHTILRELAKRTEDETASRLKQVGKTQLAAHHLASERHLANLRDAQTEVRKQLLVVEQKRTLQQEQYLSAHAGREMLSDLKKRASEAWEKDENRREQKRLQDFFLSRRKSNHGVEAAKKL